MSFQTTQFLMPKYLLLMWIMNNWCWPKWRKPIKTNSNDLPLRSKTNDPLLGSQTKWDDPSLGSQIPLLGFQTNSIGLRCMTQIVNTNFPNERVAKNHKRISKYISLICKSCKTENQTGVKKTKPNWIWTKTNCRIQTDELPPKLLKFKLDQKRSFSKWNQYQNKSELNWEMNQIKENQPELNPT